MSTVDDIVDAEIVGERTYSSAGTELLPVRNLVATRLAPAVETVKANWLSWMLATLRFALWTFPLDCLRGVQTWVRAWWKWKTLATQTSRAATPGKGLGSSENWLQERRDRRTVGTIVGVLALLGGLALFWWLAPVQYKQYAGVVLVLALFASGHAWTRKLDAPADARPPGWDGTIDSLRRAMRAARVISKDQSVWMAPGTRPEKVGVGTRLVLDLDAGVTWLDVMTKQSAVGSALGVSSEFMLANQGAHDGQVELWFTAEDPFRGGPERWPLMDSERCDAWDASPFGRTPNGTEIPLKLMYSNYLGGGLPGAGKSYTARVVAAPFILDPDVRIFCANGKGDGAWEAIKSCCADGGYIRGARSEDGWTLVAMLDTVIEEMHARYDFTTAQGVSKIRPEHGYAPWLVIIDELQQYTTLADATEETVWGKKKAPLGLLIAAKLTDLAKLARASGIILVLLTQKPSEKSLPLELRDQISTRYANRVGNHHVSGQILGKSPADGVDASKVSARYKGLGVLVPDMEECPVPGYPLVRPYLIDEADWDELGRRGVELRRQAGTLNFLRGSSTLAYPLPELLERIFEHTSHLADTDRVGANELRMTYAPEMSEKAFGGLMRRWTGVPNGRAAGNKGPSGPLVGNLRKAVQRIREGGPIEV